MGKSKVKISKETVFTKLFKYYLDFTQVFHQNWNRFWPKSKKSLVNLRHKKYKKPRLWMIRYRKQSRDYSWREYRRSQEKQHFLKIIHILYTKVQNKNQQNPTGWQNRKTKTFSAFAHRIRRRRNLKIWRRDTDGHLRLRRIMTIKKL